MIKLCDYEGAKDSRFVLPDLHNTYICYSVAKTACNYWQCVSTRWLAIVLLNDMLYFHPAIILQADAPPNNEIDFIIPHSA